MSAPALVTWIIWSDSAPLRTPTELGRCRAADKPSAEAIAAGRFPGVRLLVQSAASASVAEPVPLAKPRKFYGGTRARAKAKQRRAHERARDDQQPMAPLAKPHDAGGSVRPLAAPVPRDREQGMSLVGFSARNHPQQAVRDAVDDRRTPFSLWAPLNATHRFTVDVAASEANRLCERYWDRNTDGLLRSWAGERVWCNPPFSRLEPWVAKAWGEMRAGCELVVMLMPANRCEQKFWQTWIEPFRDGPPIDGISLRSRFLAGRPRFAAPDAPVPHKGDRPPFGCVLLTWTREAQP